MVASAGYSGTPLAKKLGFKAGMRVHAANAPDGYADWLVPLPEGIEFDARPSRHADLVHAFLRERAALAAMLATLRKTLRPDVPVWISWPKRASGEPTDLTEDIIRELALPLGFVDIKVCAVSDMWSGLKLVVRKELRA